MSTKPKSSTAPSEQSPQLLSLKMTTPQIGWALMGNQPELVRTTDGGNTWTAAMPSLRGTPYFYALDSQTAWLAMLQGASQPTTVYVTNNGGISWQHGPTFETHIAGGGSSASGPLYFLNAQDGWLEEPSPGNAAGAASGQGPGTPAPLYATSDGGLHWHLLTGSLPSAGSLTFMSTKIGFLCSEDTAHPLYSTADGGVSWKPVVSFPTGVEVVDGPVFNGPDALTWAPQSPPTGIQFGTESPVQLIASTDGGSTWTTRLSAFSVPAVDDVQVLSAMTAVAVTSDGAVHITVDGGKTWTTNGPGSVLKPLLSKYMPQQIDFTSPSVGWLQLQLGPSFTCKWFRTLDGGRTWTLLQ